MLRMQMSTFCKVEIECKHIKLKYFSIFFCGVQTPKCEEKSFKIDDFLVNLENFRGLGTVKIIFLKIFQFYMFTLHFYFTKVFIRILNIINYLNETNRRNRYRRIVQNPYIPILNRQNKNSYKNATRR